MLLNFKNMKNLTKVIFQKKVIMTQEKKNTKYSYNKIGFNVDIATLERQHGILVDLPMKEPAQYSELMIKEEKTP